MIKLEISPEPREGERKAIERALAELSADERPAESAWWRRGLEENLSEEGPLDREPPFSQESLGL